MKLQYTKLLVIAALSTSFALAGGDKGNGFIDTAEKYERQAKDARDKGNDEAAQILERMAEIKRDAAKGKHGNWDEYHKLAANLKKAMGWDKGDKKCDKGDHEKNEKKKGIVSYKDKSAAEWERKKKEKEEAEKLAKAKGNPKKSQPNRTRQNAEQSETASNKFIEQAKSHYLQADQARKAGNNHAADIHSRLSQILVNASMLAKRGDNPDLSEYFETQKQLFNIPSKKVSTKDDVDNW